VAQASEIIAKSGFTAAAVAVADQGAIADNNDAMAEED
jgi:hypothetical protein